jgi:probable phosphoglycerate mutase
VADNYEMERVVTSPSGRAEKTAKGVSNHANIPMETDDNLKEIDIGRYSGLTKEEVKERNPDFFSRRESKKWTCSWPDGE